MLLVNRKRWQRCLSQKKFRFYLLLKRPFVLFTDQQAPRTVFAKKEIHGRLMRWLDFLAEYDFRYEYQKGSSNVANYLTRISHGEKGVHRLDERSL